MALTIAEKPLSRSATESAENDSSTVLEYIVRGSADDDAVHQLVQETLPAFHRGLVYQNYSLDPVFVDAATNEGIWDVSAQYGETDPKESTYTFDTSGGTQHITQSLKTVGKYPHPHFEPAPDFKGAIGVTHEDVEGVDITVPVYNFSETHYIPDAQVTDEYKAILFFLTGRVNVAAFRNFKTGEVLFLGASGAKRGQDDWEITFRFAALPNVTNLEIGDAIIVESKKGWELLWVRYADVEDKGAATIVKQPIAAYVEKVYEDGPFDSLGI